MLVKAYKLFKKFKTEFTPVSGAEYKSRYRQLTEVMQLLIRCQMAPDEYYTYSFHKLGVDYAHILNYIPKYHLTKRFRPTLNNRKWASVIENKLLFNIYYHTLNLPVVDIYGCYEPQYGLTVEGEPLTNPEEFKKLLLKNRPRTIVLKPLGGGKGRNIIVIKDIFYKRTEIIFTTSLGHTLSFPDIIAHLKIENPGFPYRGYILEARVEQHSELDRINPWTLNTIRALTILKKDNSVHFYYPVLKLGREDSYIDNICSGALYAPINPLSGVIDKGRFGDKYNNDLYSAHPDTFENFAGLRIPYWEELKELCIAAAKNMPFFRSLGWDIAITPDGPLLLEGNDKHLIEILNPDKGVLQPEMRKILAEFGLEFPENKLPIIDVKHVLKSLKSWSSS